MEKRLKNTTCIWIGFILIDKSTIYWEYNFEFAKSKQCMDVGLVVISITYVQFLFRFELGIHMVVYILMRLRSGEYIICSIYNRCVYVWGTDQVKHRNEWCTKRIVERKILVFPQNDGTNSYEIYVCNTMYIYIYIYCDRSRTVCRIRKRHLIRGSSNFNVMERNHSSSSSKTIRITGIQNTCPKVITFVYLFYVHTKFIDFMSADWLLLIIGLI